METAKKKYRFNFLWAGEYKFAEIPACTRKQAIFLFQKMYGYGLKFISCKLIKA